MPTDEQRGFWSAIRANPLDDTPRLVYADWLQEHGDEARAEFIRVQCALAKLSADRRKNRKERPALEAREKELLAAYGEEWLAPFRDWAGRTPFRRGFLFVSSLGLELTRVLSETADSVEPVEIVRVYATRYDYHDASLVALARWAGSDGIRELLLEGATNEHVTVIAEYGHFGSLSRLGLYGSISDAGVRELARWHFATGLRILDLKGNPITHTSAFVLAESPHLEHLEQLDLTSTRINADGRERLRERFGHKVQLDPEPV